MARQRHANRLRLILVLGLSLGPASALAVDCGDVLAGGSVRIDGDILQCDTNPALTIEGPVNVNFNDFKVECRDASVGIRINGQGARLQNGTVLNCVDGIDVRGDGQHRILKLRVRSTDDVERNRGFRVRSDGNQLIQNSVEDFNGEGFRIQGDENRLRNNQALNNDVHGFRLQGDDNDLVNNRAEGNEAEGFRLDSDDNRLANNTAVGNGDQGFRARDGGSNTLVNNLAEANGAAGFGIESDDNVLRNNTALDNSGDGILLDADEEDSEFAENNQISHNKSRGNGGFDLADENLDCDDNRWFKNAYETRNQNCVD